MMVCSLQTPRFLDFHIQFDFRARPDMLAAEGENGVLAEKLNGHCDENGGGDFDRAPSLRPASSSPAPACIASCVMSIISPASTARGDRHRCAG